MCSRGSVNELVHTSRSVKEDGKRDGGGIGRGRWREEGMGNRQKADGEKYSRDCTQKKKPKQVGGRESVKRGSHGVVGAALENTKFPSLKPSSLTG